MYQLNMSQSDIVTSWRGATIVTFGTVAPGEGFASIEILTGRCAVPTLYALNFLNQVTST